MTFSLQCVVRLREIEWETRERRDLKMSLLMSCLRRDHALNEDYVVMGLKEIELWIRGRLWWDYDAEAVDHSLCFEMCLKMVCDFVQWQYNLEVRNLNEAQFFWLTWFLQSLKHKNIIHEQNALSLKKSHKKVNRKRHED